MTKNAYNVEGDFQMGRIRQHFTLEFVAETEDAAREAAYANLGSRHSVKRREVDIKTVSVASDPSGITKKRLE